MVKPITGTWFEFQHHSIVEGKYWDSACAAFTCAQWDKKIKEMSDFGMKYLVLMCVACFGEAYYKTPIYPLKKLGCDEPVKTMFGSADKYGMKVFVSNGYFGKDLHTPNDAEANRMSMQAMEELVKLYGHHKSFYGWYFPREAGIRPYFKPEYVEYVKEFNKKARELTPGKKTLIAPYWLNEFINTDDKFSGQLAEMNPDIVAYQCGAGVKHSTVDQLSERYAKLRKAHDRVKNVKLWADMEVFDFEGAVYKSALLPAKIERVKAQMEAISPHVDEILIYQYQGMVSKPGTDSFAGHPDAANLYNGYTEWRKKGFK